MSDFLLPKMIDYVNNANQETDYEGENYTFSEDHRNCVNALLMLLDGQMKWSQTFEGSAPGDFLTLSQHPVRVNGEITIECPFETGTLRIITQFIPDEAQKC